MQIFYLIRHGETEWNRLGRLQGHTDIELNELGRNQALVLKDFLVHHGIKQIVSSDLKRAFQTAEISMPGFKIERDSRLREVYLGQAEGSDRHKMRESFGDALIDQWLSAKNADFLAHFPGGESRRQGVDRLKTSIKEWLIKHPGPTAFFTHGLLLRSFAQDVLQRGHENLRAPNCSVFEFGYSKEDFSLRQIYWTDPEES